MSDAKVSSSVPFLKNLASSDRNSRIASIDALHAFLSSKRSFTVIDAQKLWTGLFYALWMTDRPIPQQKLAQELASLVFSVARKLVPAWLTGFWAVMSAKWTEIDALRMQKFLLLVRRVFAAQLRWMKLQDHAGTEVDEIMTDVVSGYCFEEEGDLRKVPVGLRLHCLDIWVDELEREKILEDEQGAHFVGRIGDLVRRLKTSVVKPVREKARESYDEDERLPWSENDGEEMDEGRDVTMRHEVDEGEDDGWGGFDD